MKRFPWRVFFKFAFDQWLIFNVIAIVIGISISAFIVPMQVDDLFWLKWFFYFTLLSLIGSFLNAYRFSRPIYRTLYMALKMANKKQVEGIQDRKSVV